MYDITHLTRNQTQIHGTYLPWAKKCVIPNFMFIIYVSRTQSYKCSTVGCITWSLFLFLQDKFNDGFVDFILCHKIQN